LEILSYTQAQDAKLNMVPENCWTENNSSTIKFLTIKDTTCASQPLIHQKFIPDVVEFFTLFTYIYAYDIQNQRIS